MKFFTFFHDWKQCLKNIRRKQKTVLTVSNLFKREMNSCGLNDKNVYTPATPLV